MKDLLLSALFIFLPLVSAAAETLILLPSSPELSSEGLPKGWEPLTFKKIERHTHYEWSAQEHAVHAISSSSASGIIYRLNLDPAGSPLLRWRWRVPHALPKGNELSKAGDDYAARVYVTFRYDPSKAGAGMRLKYGIAKKMYGEYPPHSSLSYVWASKEEPEAIIVSPYTDKAMMVLLQKGAKNAGTWQDQEVNVVDDYQKAFGSKPPIRARIAIMSQESDGSDSNRSG